MSGPGVQATEAIAQDRRVDSSLGHRAVTYSEMCESHAELSEAQKQRHWQNLGIAQELRAQLQHENAQAASPNVEIATAAGIPSIPSATPSVRSSAQLESGVESSFQQRDNEPRVEDFTKRRLISFLCLHVLTFAAEIGAMATFLFTQDYFFFTAILLVFLFSGVFCAHAAWEVSAPSLKCRCLPLKRLKLWSAVLLAIPLGIGQGVIILLAFEEYFSRIAPGQGRDGHRQMPANKFHLKAVNGMFEGFLSCAVLLYSYWSLQFPDDERAITKVSPFLGNAEGPLLAVLGLTAFLQSGIGLLELDFCISKTISKRMRRSMLYEFMHWLFRVTEVMSRVMMFIAFMVIMRAQGVEWWWIPLAVDFIVTILLAAIYGGAEKTWLVRILCCWPCVFANVFLFIDSPYKRRAASRLSRCLNARNALEQIILPSLVAFNGYSNYTEKKMMEDLQQFWLLHWPTNIAALVSVPLYWMMLWWITSTTIHKNNIVDIFSACEEGSVERLTKVMKELTKSKAIGLNINCFDIEGKTPLMFAALGGHDKACKHLLKEGAQVDLCMFRKATFSWRTVFFISVRRRWTALHMAAWKGHAEVVKVLLEGGANTPSVSPDDDQDDETFVDAFKETPLHVASWSGHEEAVRLLVVRHPQWVLRQNAQGKTPEDLAKNDAIRQAILAPTAGGEDGGRAALLLQLTPQTSTRHRESVDQNWPQQEVPISRTSNDLIAPGLCSYITSSCGGALGKAFLENAPLTAETGLARLPTNSELDDTYNSTMVEDASGPLPSVPASIHSNSFCVQIPQMEDLEPISGNGDPVSPQCLRSRQMSVTDTDNCSGCCCQRRNRSQMSITIEDPFQSERFRYVPDEAILGQGAYGIVWRAMDRRTRTWYAVKNIKTFRRGAGDIARRECEVADRIRFMPHPCLVHLFHVHHFADASLYCLVMEFCPCGDLLQTIRRFRRERRVYAPPPQSRHWLAQVFMGLEHMHLRMDTLLRDLKPENCVLTSTGRVKITDFGFGRFGVEACGRWSFGIPTGSPGYVAPEILRKTEYDYRVDLYSLGVLIWVLLTGGLTTSSEPVPPLGRMRRPMDFEAHLQDWLLLAQCITKPAEHGALPLPEDAQTLVAKLTHNRPDNRLRHREIREHVFMKNLNLPNFDAAPKEVEGWLRSTDNPVAAA